MSAKDRGDVVPALERLLGGSGAVVTEPHELARYEQGWRYGAGKALAAVRPSTTEEVSRVLAFATERGIRVIAQGANTGLVGASTPDATGEMLVLGFERLSRELTIDPVDRTVTAGAGVLLSQLDAALAEKGLLFPIDLGADPSVGGMIATNAAGTRVLRYGDMRQNVLGLEAVLADGTVLDLMRPLRKNNTGFDARQLFIGTSGVFGVVTRAVLKVAPASRPARDRAGGRGRRRHRARPPDPSRAPSRRRALRVRGHERGRAGPGLPPPAPAAEPVRRRACRPTW